MATSLINVAISRDENENGEMAYLVTPYYCRGGKVMSVPDTKGWPTMAQAVAEKSEIESRKSAIDTAE